MLKAIALITCFRLLPNVLISINCYHFLTATGLVIGLVVTHGGTQVHRFDDRGLMKQ